MVNYRDETPDDIPSIHDVVARAFGRDHEARIVDALREHGAALLSLVAVDNGRVVGHVLYSPVTAGAVTGAGLAPLAVLPEFQRHGIGSALVTVGNTRVEEIGCPFIVVIGHPAFYPRFGFAPAGSHGLTSEWKVPDDTFMVKIPSRLPPPDIRAVAHYRPEFSAMV